MKEWTNRVGAFLFVLTAVLFLVPCSPVLAQPEEEEGGGTPARLGRELATRLGELDAAADQLSKVEEGESVAAETEALAEILEAIASRASEIEDYLASKGEADKLRQAEKLGNAVAEAQEALGGIGEDYTETAGLIIRVCREVVGVGGEVVADLGESK